MPKAKTRKAAAKRFLKTASGKFLRKKSGKKHLLEWKPASKKRSFRKKVEVSPSDRKNIQAMLFTS